MVAKFTKVKLKINHFSDTFMQIFCAYTDKYIFSKMNIPWHHEYKWEKHPYLPSKESCAYYGIEYGVEQPGGFQLVLYDKKRPVYAAGCMLFGKSYREDSVRRTYDTFYKVMDNYIESHKYFSMFLWYLKHVTYIGLW